LLRMVISPPIAALSLDRIWRNRMFDSNVVRCNPAKSQSSVDNPTDDL
jgi:hypothetical protein